MQSATQSPVPSNCESWTYLSDLKSSRPPSLPPPDAVRCESAPPDQAIATISASASSSNGFFFVGNSTQQSPIPTYVIPPSSSSSIPLSANGTSVAKQNRPFAKIKKFYDPATQSYIYYERIDSFDAGYNEDSDYPSNGSTIGGRGIMSISVILATGAFAMALGIWIGRRISDVLTTAAA